METTGISKGLKQNLQRLYATHGYKGAIDGIFGVKTEKAIKGIVSTFGKTSLTYKWSNARKAIAAGQILLEEYGFKPGTIDGYWGHNSENAFIEWEYAQLNEGKALILDATLQHLGIRTVFPPQSGFRDFYGAPGVGGPAESQLVSIVPPYQMRLDYALGQKVKTIRLHKKCADSALAALTAIEKHYGEKRLGILGLDRFAGGYFARLMRGGTSWSTHAYGAALDFYAAPNGLTTRCPQALFCGEAYVKFFDIWEDHGWTSLGRAIGRDWMHVQAGSVS